MKTKLTTKSKLRAVVMVAVVLMLAVYVLLALAVWGADAANETGARRVVVGTAVGGRGEEVEEVINHETHETHENGDEECMIGEGWILVTDEVDVDPVPDGYSMAVTKCGVYLIPYSVSEYPGPGEEPYPYPEPTEVPGECIRAWDGKPCWPEE